MDEYEVLFDKAMKSINEFWTKEMGEDLKKNTGALAALSMCETIMDDTWDDSMYQFRNALVKFYKICKMVGDRVEQTI